MIPIIEAVLTEIEEKEGGYNDKDNATYGTFEDKLTTSEESIHKYEEIDAAETTKNNKSISRLVHKKPSSWIGYNY